MKTPTEFDVLCVDDEEDWLETVKDALLDHGYNALCVTTLDEARNILNNYVFKLVICDGFIHSSPEYGSRTCGDGALFAQSLANSGTQPVLLLSSEDPPNRPANLPFVNKNMFLNGEGSISDIEGFRKLI